MAETPHQPDSAHIPSAVAEKKSGRSLQIVWLIPLLALLVGGWLAVKAILDKGPTITITFKTAEGLEAGKTKIKYKDVDVGLVQSISFSSDLKSVIVTAEMAKQATKYMTESARFWVVRARISGGSISGLGTLLSGSYIGIDLGKGGGKEESNFTGLESPPAFSSESPGSEYLLHSHDLGSLDSGSPVYFRRLQVGQVANYELDKDGKGVTIKVFVNAPYDKFVSDNTRFWQASGIDMTLDASGVKIDTQSVVSILVGGLAFETPPGAIDLPQAADKSTFDLFSSRVAAMKNPDSNILKAVMIFNESARGLTVGAPVELRGIEIGQVTGVKIELDPKHIYIVVEADIYPLRLRARATEAVLAKTPPPSDAQRRANVARLVEAGMRAQMRSGNLLTGQMYIALDFFPAAPKVKYAANDPVAQLPTMPSSMIELQDSLSSIASKLKNFPLDEIGSDLKTTLRTANKMMERIDSEITPEARGALEDARKAMNAAESTLKPESPLAQDARATMSEIARAAAAFRVLADYLERHPEALLSGKKEEK